MFTISKRFDFSASHQLSGLPEGHQCARLHGHNYELHLTLTDDKLDETGFVKDYGQLDFVKTFIDNTLEHRHLNDLFPFNPTAENMAKYFYTVFKQTYPQLIQVTIKETEKTTATYMDTPNLPNLIAEFTELVDKLKVEMKGLTNG
jgi:6-pyruvoyltetrahydropterin/6-carboxytetrahydropterin synthase